MDWLHWLDSCPSTNTWALDRLHELSHGDVVFTPQQTAGRGQQGRTWYSPPGVLTASFVLDRIPAVQLAGFSLAAGLATIYAVEDLMPDLQEQLRLKWPNDVVLNGRKLAGILCEGVTSGAVAKVVVGIGLNRCADFVGLGSHPQNPISLHQVAAVVPDEVSLLAHLRHYLLETAGLIRSGTQHSQLTTGLSALLPMLRHRDALIGSSITLDRVGEKISGQAAGIDDRGWLLLRLPDGTQHAFSSGHVHWHQEK